MGKFTDALEKVSPANALRNHGERQEDQEREQPSPVGSSGLEKSGLQGTVISGRQNWEDRLVLATEPQSPIAERFRRLRGTILHPPSGKRPKTILITSLVAGEGKGFVCANLGYAIAEEMEHHALMVDCDFRRPNLAKMFGVANQTGFVDYLQDKVDLSLLLRKTGQPKLSLLPSGRPPQNPAEILTSSKIISVIDELAERYQDRVILFDSPPTVVASETSILAKRVDGVILVIRAGASSQELVKKFVEELGTEKIIGVVFNGYEESKVDSVLYKNSNYDCHNYYA